MKINPISIQSYQQAVRPERPADRESSIAGTAKSVTITPQKKVGGSDLAVNLKDTSYADSLSPAEKQALDLLFGKYSGDDRFGGTYQSGTTTGEAAVGRTIDLKV